MIYIRNPLYLGNFSDWQLQEDTDDPGGQKKGLSECAHFFPHSMTWPNHAKTHLLCHIKSMPCRLKPNHGSSVVHPCSWREVKKVYASISFSTGAFPTGEVGMGSGIPRDIREEAGWPGCP